MTLLQRKAQALDAQLKKLFPYAAMILNYGTHFELLVAVQLSAQCTDVMVNKITDKLFKKYVSLNDYVNADPNEFKKDITSSGFFNNKTKNILAAAKMIQKKFKGKIPHTMKAMLLIPGVARKTANVVLGNAYHIVEGIAVDTHVRRFANIYGLSKHTNPDKIEQDLMRLLPEKDWFGFTYRVIEYGRKFCPARKHDHAHCPLVVSFRT